MANHGWIMRWTALALTLGATAQAAAANPAPSASAAADRRAQLQLELKEHDELAGFLAKAHEDPLTRALLLHHNALSPHTDHVIAKKGTARLQVSRNGGGLILQKAGETRSPRVRDLEPLGIGNVSALRGRLGHALAELLDRRLETPHEELIRLASESVERATAKLAQWHQLPDLQLLVKHLKHPVTDGETLMLASSSAGRLVLDSRTEKLVFMQGEQGATPATLGTLELFGIETEAQLHKALGDALVRAASAVQPHAKPENVETARSILQTREANRAAIANFLINPRSHADYHLLTGVLAHREHGELVIARKGSSSLRLGPNHVQSAAIPGAYVLRVNSRNATQPANIENLHALGIADMAGIDELIANALANLPPR